jgi:hypothetical protein
MANFFKSLFGSENSKGSSQAEAIEYNGFSIQPTPKNVSNGWSTEAMITREIDGETQTHHFIRADTTASQDGAIELTISKAKITIDQLGEKIFTDR